MNWAVPTKSVRRSIRDQEKKENNSYVINNLFFSVLKVIYDHGYTVVYSERLSVGSSNHSIRSAHFVMSRVSILMSSSSA